MEAAKNCSDRPAKKKKKGKKIDRKKKKPKIKRKMFKGPRVNCGRN